MPTKEMSIPIDVEDPSAGEVIAHYAHQLTTIKDYFTIVDLRCTYAIVGLGRSETSLPTPYFADCRFHQDLEHIVKVELGENAELFAYGQLTHTLDTSSGFHKLTALRLNNPSVIQTPDTEVEQNLQLLLKNINPAFLKPVFYLTWTENGTEREWRYRRQEKKLERLIEQP